MKKIDFTTLREAEKLAKKKNFLEKVRLASKWSRK